METYEYNGTDNTVISYTVAGVEVVDRTVSPGEHIYCDANPDPDLFTLQGLPEVTLQPNSDPAP